MVILSMARYGRQDIDKMRSIPIRRLFRYWELMRDIISEEQHIES